MSNVPLRPIYNYHSNYMKTHISCYFLCLHVVAYRSPLTAHNLASLNDGVDQGTWMSHICLGPLPKLTVGVGIVGNVRKDMLPMPLFLIGC